MKFAKANGKIKCIRTVTSTDGSEKEVLVTEFDDVINTVAPHVAASLHTNEIDQLNTWLKDHLTLKTKLKEESLEKTILETMPALLEEASNALDQIDALDTETYQSIEKSLKLFTKKLSTFDPLITEDSPMLEEIEDNEILKNQLGKIEKEL